MRADRGLQAGPPEVGAEEGHGRPAPGEPGRGVAGRQHGGRDTEAGRPGERPPPPQDPAPLAHCGAVNAVRRKAWSAVIRDPLSDVR